MKSCHWNIEILCRYQSCPLHSPGFSRALERWSQDHDGRAWVFDGLPNSGIRANTAENAMLARARIFRLFEDGVAVLNYLCDGARMTPEICRDLRGGFRGYLEMVKAEAVKNEMS